MENEAKPAVSYAKRSLVLSDCKTRWDEHGSSDSREIFCCSSMLALRFHALGISAHRSVKEDTSNDRWKNWFLDLVLRRSTRSRAVLSAWRRSSNWNFIWSDTDRHRRGRDAGEFSWQCSSLEDSNEDQNDEVDRLASVDPLSLIVNVSCSRFFLFAGNELFFLRCLIMDDIEIDGRSYQMP